MVISLAAGTCNFAASTLLILCSYCNYDRPPGYIHVFSISQFFNFSISQFLMYLMYPMCHPVTHLGTIVYSNVMHLTGRPPSATDHLGKARSIAAESISKEFDFSR